MRFEPGHLPSIAELFDIELLDRDLYRGINEVPENDRPNIYGGQVAAQRSRPPDPRGLYAGSMYQADGRLGVTITQESLLRP